MVDTLLFGQSVWRRIESELPTSIPSIPQREVAGDYISTGSDTVYTQCILIIYLILYNFFGKANTIAVSLQILNIFENDRTCSRCFYKRCISRAATLCQGLITTLLLTGQYQHVHSDYMFEAWQEAAVCPFAESG